MATPTLSLELMQQAVDAKAEHDTLVAAAAALDIPANTFKSRVRRAKEFGLTPSTSPVAVPIPPDDLPFEERLSLMKRRNNQRIVGERAKSWQRVKIPISGPYGLCFFGDPHMDDPYCDLVSLERHGRLCASTEGLYGVNGGDSINNWVGRLQAIYAEQSATATEGYELVEWFMHDLGIDWALWLLGNHDVWNTGERVFRRIAGKQILMRDWDAKVVLSSPDGDCRLWARHDFKGTSIYNELHGQKRAAMFNGTADIYAAFHRHTWGTSQGEMAVGKRYCLIRARGYKECDDYSVKGGFDGQEGGQSVVAVVEPREGRPPRVHAFEDVELGADFLTFLRRKGGV